jgi:hypothetical protein
MINYTDFNTPGYYLLLHMKQHIIIVVRKSDKVDATKAIMTKTVKSISPEA